MRPQLPARKSRDRRKWLSERERGLAAVSERQHGVISRRQLLDAGLGPRTIGRRLEAGRLHRLHREVYAVGDALVSRRGRWMAAVLACGDGALLSHRSAAQLWGLMSYRRGEIDVSAGSGRRRPGIAVHEGGIHDDDRAELARIPVTSVARTIFDLAEVIDGDRLARVFEEADRLRLLQIPKLDEVCARSPGRRALRPVRQLIEEARVPVGTRSPLEDRVIELCRAYDLPMPVTNVLVLGNEVDAFWPAAKLIVEADSITFHGHRAAFERDRKRDAVRQVEGYRVVRLTDRRLDREPATVAEELRRLLRVPMPDVPGLKGPYATSTPGTSRRPGERGQGTVEWVGLVAVVALLLVGLVGAGVRVPGTTLARAVASRLLCAATLADRCGDEPLLIAAYGTEVGKLVRRHMPTILLERGSRALPVDFRRCRRSECADGSARGLIHKSDAGLPVTAFVHVIDCREDGEGDRIDVADAEGPSLQPDCSGLRAGNLYLQYWTYYVDSATLRGVPIAGERGYHSDDWESVQIRISPDGSIDQRSSSHHGYNYVRSAANAASDAGLIPLRDAAEAIGARPNNGWGPETRLLLVSGGSHAGNANGFLRVDRITPGRRVHLVALEQIAEEESDAYAFAVSPPWLKKVWRDPEAAGTD